jgi:hypothetical protein
MDEQTHPSNSLAGRLSSSSTERPLLPWPTQGSHLTNVPDFLSKVREEGRGSGAAPPLLRCLLGVLRVHGSRPPATPHSAHTFCAGNSSSSTHMKSSWCTLCAAPLTQQPLPVTRCTARSYMHDMRGRGIQING